MLADTEDWGIVGEDGGLLAILVGFPAGKALGKAMEKLDLAAERLADRIKRISPSDPLFSHLDANAAEFLRAQGFDISTVAGCKAALLWLDTARVEDAFWDDNAPVDNAADWYIGEGRIDAMKIVAKKRLEVLQENDANN